MKRWMHVFVQIILGSVFITNAMEQQSDQSKKITVTIKLVDDGKEIVFNKENDIIEMPKEMLLLSSTLANVLADMGEEAFKDEKTGGWVIPEAVTEETIDMLILLWNARLSSNERTLHTIEGYSEGLIYNRKMQELVKQLKEYNFEQLYDLIKLANFFDLIFIVKAACSVFSDKIETFDDVKHVLLMHIISGPDKIIAHGILTWPNVHVYPFNSILGDLCAYSLGKGRKKVLETIPVTSGEINQQGDALFFSAPNMYVYTIKRDRVTKIPFLFLLEDQIEFDSERFALSPSGKYIVCVGKSDKNKITNMYLIDMETGHRRVIPRPELYQDWTAKRKFYKGNVANIIFSPDEKNILALYDNAIYQYDTITGNLISQQPMKLTDEGKVMINISFGKFDPAYLFVKYHGGADFFNALYDYEKKSWVSEEHIPRNIDDIPSNQNSKINYFFVANVKEEFGLANIYSAKKIENKKDVFMLQEIVSFENLAEDEINYRCLASVVSPAKQGADKPYESMVILADIVPDDVRILIKDYNKPLGMQRITLSEALYLYTAKLYDWDPSKREKIDQLFSEVGINLEPGIIDVRKLATIKNWPVPELEYISEVIAGGQPLHKENVPVIASQPTIDMPQQVSQPSLWQRYAPTFLRRGAQAARQQLSAVQQQFRNLYNNYSTRINYALGAAAVGGLGWLYLKYGKDSGLSLSK